MEDGFANGLALGEARNNGGNMWDNGMGIFGIIALLAFANGGFGFGGNRGYGAEMAGTLAGNDALVSNALQTTQLEAAANQRQTCADFANTNSNITNGNYQTQNVVQGWGYNLTRDIGTAATALNANINTTGSDIKDRLFQMAQDNASCCCRIERDVDSVKFDMANYVAGLSQTFNAGIQSVKDMFRSYQEQNLRDENMRSYIQSQFCGVVRVPNQWTYNAGQSPFCGGCGCNNY